jgi:hypothetical protein
MLGAGEEALHDLANPCSSTIRPIKDTPSGAGGTVRFFRVTLKSGCPGEGDAVLYLKFWVDEDAHLVRLRPGDPQIPK